MEPTPEGDGDALTGWGEAVMKASMHSPTQPLNRHKNTIQQWNGKEDEGEVQGRSRDQAQVHESTSRQYLEKS